MPLTDAIVVLASGAPADLLPARQQMAVWLGFHIILASFGVAFPAMILVMHRRGIVRDDPAALRLAKRWSKVSAVVFAIGAVSGTVLSFEMGLLWPGLMGRFGDVLGLPFALEGLSFFTEAIFLGLYLYGWDRMRPRWHLAMLKHGKYLDENLTWPTNDRDMPGHGSRAAPSLLFCVPLCPGYGVSRGCSRICQDWDRCAPIRRGPGR